MIVYKVVRDWNKKLQTGYSAIITKGAYNTVYKIGREVTAFEETIGLFVFETQDDALQFVDSKLYMNTAAAAILECRAPKQRALHSIEYLLYSKTTKLRKQMLQVDFLRNIRYRTHKNIERVKRQGTPSFSCPTGTVTVRKLTPTKVIWTSTIERSRTNP